MPEYILGVGDELTLIQLNEAASGLMIISNIPQTGNDEGIIEMLQNLSLATNVLTDFRVIGSNGNILLLGLGNILAANRTLE